jgi:hypothetical protein
MHQGQTTTKLTGCKLTPPIAVPLLLRVGWEAMVIFLRLSLLIEKVDSTNAVA